MFAGTLCDLGITDSILEGAVADGFTLEANTSTYWFLTPEKRKKYI